MLQTLQEIADDINCRKQLITQYLCRCEFSKIKKIQRGHKSFFDVTDSDKELLKFYIDKGKRRSGHMLKNNKK